MSAVEVLRPSTCLVCAQPITGLERPEQRPMPVTLNLHEDGETWVANATSKGFARRVEGVAHRDCLNIVSVQLYGMRLA
jgi:hypothetical protein